MRLKALCILACLWPLWVWAAPYSSPALERERLLKVTLGTLKKLHLEPQGPPRLELEVQAQFKAQGKTLAKGATKLKDGRVAPSLTGQLGAQGFQTSGLKLTLALDPLAAPQEAELRETLAQALGQDPKGEWLQLVAPGATPPEPAPAPETTTDGALAPEASSDLGSAAAEATSDQGRPSEPAQPLAELPALEPSSDEPDLTQGQEGRSLVKGALGWIWIGAVLALGGLSLAWLLGKKAKDPAKNLEKLNQIPVEGELDFTELKEFKGLFKETPAPGQDRESIKNDLCDLLKVQPDWARQLALDRGPRGLVKLMGLFGPQRSEAAFAGALGPKRFQELLAEAQGQAFSPEEEGQMLMELHQGFFLKKLKELKQEAAAAQPAPESPKPTPAPAPPAPPRASKKEEAAALSFLADCSETEIYRLIAGENPMIQALVLRHWPGDGAGLAKRLKDPLGLGQEQQKTRQITQELLHQIAQGLERRLKKERAVVDPVVLGSLLDHLEPLSPLDREAFLSQLEEKDSKLGQTARAAFTALVQLPQTDQARLSALLRPIDPKLLAQGLWGLDKSLQEPILLSIAKEPRSALIKGLRGPEPEQRQRHKARALLAQALADLK